MLIEFVAKYLLISRFLEQSNKTFKVLSIGYMPFALIQNLMHPPLELRYVNLMIIPLYCAPWLWNEDNRIDPKKPIMPQTNRHIKYEIYLYMKIENYRISRLILSFLICGIWKF